MKILVISLLRLGDFVQTVPVLQALRTQFPVRRLDVLTHEPARALQPMIPDVNRWWTIDRDGLQEGLGRADIPLLASFSVLREKLDEINAQNYDCIINLTQTHYSAWIAGYLRTHNRAGLFFDARGQMHVHSPWFQYLDEHAPLSVKDVFHYTDIFFYGSGLKGPERHWNMHETDEGRREVAALKLGDGEKIVLQTLTSDTKKNWADTSWLKCIRQIQLFRPQAQFVLLGAPSEQRKIEKLVIEAQKQGVKAQEAILSLEGAFSLLKSSQLLITGDTSIKHLANATAIPIIELSIGSSDFRRTGVYKAGSLIVQSSVDCAPCPHSSPCSQTTHKCAKQLSPDLVSTLAHQSLAGNPFALRELAREYSSEARILQTRMTANGYWIACGLHDQAPEALVEKMVERSTWKFLLNREYMDPLAQFGSEGLYLKQELDDVLPRQAFSEVARHLDFLESEASKLAEETMKQLTSVRLRSPRLTEEGLADIGGLRRAQAQLERFSSQAQIKVKLIRSLKSQLMEKT